MSNSKLLYYSLINSFATFIYVVLVAWTMFNGDKVFGKMNTLLGPVAFLLLFVVSATIVGILVLGKPVGLYLEGFKKEAIKLLIYTVVCLIIITALALLAMMIVNSLVGN
ncbi:MAG: hypothetical protein V1712_03870 [Patescibacteria group bacterium]